MSQFNNRSLPIDTTKFLDAMDTLAQNTRDVSTVVSSNGSWMSSVSRLEQVNIFGYLFICLVGLVGNGLVIYVVLIFAKMKTVTNMYILNLAVTDLVFLLTLPVTVATILLRRWVLGLVLCKVYFVFCAVNIFAGALNLCVMTADRYLAVCHPIRSLKYRTPRVALSLCLGVWLITFLVSLPFLLYSSTLEHSNSPGAYTCQLMWPDDQILSHMIAVTWYSFMLGYLIPVFFISILYLLVILRLRRLATKRRSQDKRRCHGRITRLILTVVSVYVVCWLPYWTLQVYSAGRDRKERPEPSFILLSNAFQLLSYANSMLNPFLYAFLSDTFRQSFSKAFKCLAAARAECLTVNGMSLAPSSEKVDLQQLTSHLDLQLVSSQATSCKNVTSSSCQSTPCLAKAHPGPSPNLSQASLRIS